MLNFGRVNIHPHSFQCAAFLGSWCRSHMLTLRCRYRNLMELISLLYNLHLKNSNFNLDITAPKNCSMSLWRICSWNSKQPVLNGCFNWMMNQTFTNRKWVFHQTTIVKWMWVFPKIVVPQNGWFIINGKNGWFGGTLIFGNTHV